MRPFTIWHLMQQSVTNQQQQLVSLIQELIDPDMIYLLGASLLRRRSESIFCTTAPTSQHSSDYFFLILVSKLNDKTVYQWQDQIEQHISTVIPVTTIVLETATFKEWLSDNRFFAAKVYHCSVCLYDTGNINLIPPKEDGLKKEAEHKMLRETYSNGLNKTENFLASAEILRVSKQNNMAAFMLHQAAEQALRTMLRTGTGFHSSTHNLERLIRYASMVSYQLPDIFSNKTEKEKRLFNLLKRAYRDTRYTKDYSITTNELLLLTDKVKKIKLLLVDVEKSLFNTL